MTRRTVTKAQIAAGLRLGGLTEGDTVFMHSALSACGNVEGGADAVIDAFLEVLGPSGTLAVSTLSFGDPWDAATTPSGVGLISETLRKREGAVRSLRPVHSIAAIGKRAAELCAGHEDAETNCGEGTPYTKLRDWGAKIVLFGVDMNRNTTLHGLEDIVDAPYLTDRETSAPTYMPDYQGKKIIMKKFPPGHRDFLRFTPVLREEGILTETRCGNAVVKIIDARRMFGKGLEILRRDPSFFLCENAACAFCSPFAKGGN